MVLVSPAAGSYCIDSTEVTNEDYAAFIATSPQATAQPAECLWNTGFYPSLGLPSGKETHPVVGVDWCDARAYCAWAGKHLCGKIGGGPNLYADAADATKSQWFAACSADATRAFPYGDTYAASTCNGWDYGLAHAIPVGAASACEGGYPGVMDMSGNVWEWEDSCTAATGSSDECRLRGGSFYFDASGLGCTSVNYTLPLRNTQSEAVGFRCCAD